MYLFLLCGLPLGFYLLTLLRYPAEERPVHDKAVLRGLIACLPAWLLAKLFEALIPAFWGTFFSIFTEWFDRFLPYALVPALFYLFFYKYDEKIPQGLAVRRLVSFYAGAIGPLGIIETVACWGRPNAYLLLILPFLSAALVLALPPLLLSFAAEYGSGKVRPALIMLALTLLASSVWPLFLAQWWVAALILTLGLCALVWFKVEPLLSTH